MYAWSVGVHLLHARMANEIALTFEKKRCDLGGGCEYYHYNRCTGRVSIAVRSLGNTLPSTTARSRTRSGYTWSVRERRLTAPPQSGRGLLSLIAKKVWLYITPCGQIVRAQKDHAMQR